MPTSKKTRDWYEENAENYTNHVRNSSDSIYHSYYEKPAMYSELPDLKGKSVISLGCGSGEDSQYLKSKGAKRSAGIDLSKRLIDIAKKSYPECEFYVMDMEKLEFPDEQFDLVYSSLAAHYLINSLDEMLKEAYRILKPGGILLFSDGHPLHSSMQVIGKTKDIEDRRLSIKKNQKANEEQIYGDYLTSRTITVEEGLEVEFWHQPLSETINQIIEAGFILDKVNEFKPTKEMRRVNKRIYERLNKIPEMLLFKAHKPK